MKYEPVILEMRDENRSNVFRTIQYPFASEDITKAIVRVFQNIHSYSIVQNIEGNSIILVDYKFGLIRYDISLTIRDAWDKYTNIQIDISNKGVNMEFRNYKHGLLVEIVEEITFQLKSMIAMKSTSIYNTWNDTK